MNKVSKLGATVSRARSVSGFYRAWTSLLGVDGACQA